MSQNILAAREPENGGEMQLWTDVYKNKLPGRASSKEHLAAFCPEDPSVPSPPEPPIGATPFSVIRMCQCLSHHVNYLPSL
jgi:hypothetical protein